MIDSSGRKLKPDASKPTREFAVWCHNNLKYGWNKSQLEIFFTNTTKHIPCFLFIILLFLLGFRIRKVLVFFFITNASYLPFTFLWIKFLFFCYSSLSWESFMNQLTVLWLLTSSLKYQIYIHKWIRKLVPFHDPFPKFSSWSLFSHWYCGFIIVLIIFLDGGKIHK